MARKKKQEADHSLKDFIEALDEINKAKGIDKEEIIVAVEQALVAAYKKDTRSNSEKLLYRKTGYRQYRKNHNGRIEWYRLRRRQTNCGNPRGKKIHIS